jgi:predicted TIM-barrel fold metal-dependent hydrolase
MKAMATKRLRSPVLPFLATQDLTDHHCHGVLAEGGDLEFLLTEGDGGPAAGGTAFDSLIGLAFRRWCPPLLDLAAFCGLPEYVARRAELGAIEVGRRFLGATGLGALCVDTGFEPSALLTPAQTAALARSGGPGNAAAPGGAVAAYEIVRLEQVAEHLASVGTRPGEFPEAFREALAARASRPGVVGLKSIAAYRVGLDLRPERPLDAEVVVAAGRWLADTAAGRVPRLAEEALHRFLIWTGADLGLPVQFHVGYGDRDIDLHRCNPLLLTPLLRALEPTGAAVMLLHNYPYHREAGYLAQVFPNVYCDLGLTTHNVGSRAPAVLAEALEMIPFGKFLYSSDAFGLPELYYLGATLFRDALSRFLSARLDSGDMTVDDAERIARLMCTENAARVYALPA